MLDIGFLELLLIAVVALLVLGPEKLPVTLRALGLWLARIRNKVGAIKNEISAELELEDMQRTVAIKKEQLEQELDEVRAPFSVADEPKEK